MAIPTTLEGFTHKSLITKPHSLTYSYYLSPNFATAITANPPKPILLLLHGFPDYAHMWAGVVPTLLSLNYPLIIPDLLGFAGSSKPTEPSMYNYRQQASSFAQILDNEGIPASFGARIIPVGHDWGSGNAQRFYLYHRERCQGLVLLSLAYQVPSPKPFDLDTANKALEKRFGYPQWAYWEFFTAKDAPRLMRENLERFWEVNNGNFPSRKPEEKGRDVWMREMFCRHGTMRDYVVGEGEYKGWSVEAKKYPNWEEEKKKFMQRFERDGFEGPVCYYHSLNQNTMLEDEKYLCEKEGKEDRRRIVVPLLYVGQTGDWVCMCALEPLAVYWYVVTDLPINRPHRSHERCERARFSGRLH